MLDLRVTMVAVRLEGENGGQYNNLIATFYQNIAMLLFTNGFSDV